MLAQRDHKLGNDANQTTHSRRYRAASVPHSTQATFGGGGGSVGGGGEGVVVVLEVKVRWWWL